MATRVAPRTVAVTAFPSYAPAHVDLADLDMELLEEYAGLDDDMDFLDGTNISEDTAGPNNVSDLDDDGTSSEGPKKGSRGGSSSSGKAKGGGGGSSGGGGGGPPGKKRKTAPRKKSQEQMERRRERNRILARRTRLRKKFFFESLQKQVLDLKRQNTRLKEIVRKEMKEEAPALLKTCTARIPSIVTESMAEATELLERGDFNLVKALQSTQQSFIVTDPSLPDNPIVFASQGFLDITGYPMDKVLGRNCRFLQGPDTDPAHVAAIRKGVALGADTSVCLLNYRADGTPFWNQFFVAPLRDLNGNVVYYVGAQSVIDRPVGSGGEEEEDDDEEEEEEEEEEEGGGRGGRGKRK